MIETEKVIKGLECHIVGKCETDDIKHEPCPYWKYDECEKRVMCDALKLLKESETVKLPVRPVYYADSPYLYTAFHCGKCGNRINYHSPYCSNCGKAVKWDD